MLYVMLESRGEPIQRKTDTSDTDIFMPIPPILFTDTDTTFKHEKNIMQNIQFRNKKPAHSNVT